MTRSKSGKAPIIQGRCSLDSDEGRSYLVTAEEAVRQIQEEGARGFVIYAGKETHNTSEAAFIDHDDSEAFPVPTGELTLEVLSGSGRGSHETYRNDPDDPVSNARVGSDEGEVRANNWYVIAPGSIHPSGGVYHIREDRPIATISDSDLTDRMRPASANDDTDIDYTPKNGSDESHARKVAKHYNNIQDYLTFGSDDRSESDFHVCCRMIEHGVDEREVYRFLANNSNSKVDAPDAASDYWNRTWQRAKQKVGSDANTETLPQASTGEPPRSERDTNGTALSWKQIQEWYADSDIAQTEARYQAVIKLLEEYDFITLRDTQEVYVYHEPSGVFERGGEREIEHELQGGLGRHYSQHEKREIIGHVKARTYADRDELNAAEFDEPLQCFANCVLNVETRETYDHNPKYRFTRSIPWTYDAEAECPKTDAFMDDITQREADKLTLYEGVGHALHPEYIRKKFWITFGPGDNGKTVFYKFVRELLGGLENISAVPLQKIADNRFASETILGKFANIAPDMDAKKVSDLGDLKTLTGGDDPYFFEPKGKQGFEAVNTATMLFGCNEPPVLPERGKKIETRIVPIELPFTFVSDPDPNNPLEKERIPSEQLTDEIITDEEMSGFINKALDGLERLVETYDVSLPETPKERLELYEQHSDPIKKFAIKCLDTERGSVIPKDDVYNAYIEFCRQNDVKDVSRSVFFKKLGQTTFPVSVTQPNDYGGKRCLDNATFTEHAEQYTDDVVVSSDTPDDDQTVSTRHEPVSIHDIEDDLTGYPTVEGEIKAIDYPEGENAPAVKATLVDGKSAIDVISWDDRNAVEHGEKVIIENADTSTFEGEVQLVIKPDVTTVHEAPDGGQRQIDENSEETDSESRSSDDNPKGQQSENTTVDDDNDGSTDESDGTSWGQLLADLQRHYGDDEITPENLIDRVDRITADTYAKLGLSELAEAGFLEEIDEGVYRLA